MDKMETKRVTPKNDSLYCGATRNRTGDTRPIYRQCQSFALPTELWHVYKKRVTPKNDSFTLWCHQESNRGHKDFQSFALPTELWHQLWITNDFSFAGAKVHIFFGSNKFFQENLSEKSKKMHFYLAVSHFSCIFASPFGKNSKIGI